MRLQVYGRNVHHGLQLGKVIRTNNTNVWVSCLDIPPSGPLCRANPKDPRICGIAWDREQTFTRGVSSSPEACALYNTYGLPFLGGRPQEPAPSHHMPDEPGAVDCEPSWWQRRVTRVPNAERHKMPRITRTRRTAEADNPRARGGRGG